MAKPTDRVQIQKRESSAGGGDDADSSPFLYDPLDSSEDCVELRGVFLQDATGPKDEAVGIWRDGDDIIFLDVTTGVESSLTSLLANTSDHGALTGLTGTDHHTQYLLVSGTRASTGVQTFSAGISIGGHTLSGSLISSDGVSTSNAALATAGYVGANYNNYTHPNHTGDVTSTGDGATVIAASAVTNAKMANMVQSTFKGRAAGAGTGAPVDLTATQATAILNNFTSTLKGLAPLSGGGTTNFLRADGTWAAPGGVTDHGALSGLGDDDHTQYFLVNGTRDITAGFNAAPNTDITVTLGRNRIDSRTTDTANFSHYDQTSTAAFALQATAAGATKVNATLGQILGLSIAGTSIFDISSIGLTSTATSGPRIRHTAASLTVPTINPSSDSLNTGLGSSSTTLAAISNGSTASTWVNANQTAHGTLTVEGTFFTDGSANVGTTVNAVTFAGTAMELTGNGVIDGNLDVGGHINLGNGEIKHSIRFKVMSAASGFHCSSTGLLRSMEISSSDWVGRFKSVATADVMCIPLHVASSSATIRITNVYWRFYGASTATKRFSLMYITQSSSPVVHQTSTSTLSQVHTTFSMNLSTPLTLATNMNVWAQMRCGASGDRLASAGFYYERI